MREVFVVLTGAYGNVGDGVIRRRILGWVRDAGAVHAYVGNAPADWVEQLGMRPDETVYASAGGKAWTKRLMIGRGERALILDPGQVPLGRRAIKTEALYLLLTAWTRLRGGVVIRPPRAFAGEVNRTSFTLHRLACRLSNATLWRTPRALSRMGVGEFSPDTAFQEQFIEGVSWSERALIVISMRGKRSFPSQGWVRAVEQLSESLGSQIVVASQVREDEVRSSEIVEALRERGVDARFQAWGDGSDLAQERVTRSLYQGAKVVVSDRLHVLILAAKGGAVPIEFTDHHPSKAEEHFAAIDYRGISLLTSSDDVDASSFIEASLARRPELLRLMDDASAKLDVHSATVKRLLEVSPAHVLDRRRRPRRRSRIAVAKRVRNCLSDKEKGVPVAGSQQSAVAIARRSGRRVMSRVKGAREFMCDMRRYYRYSAPAGTEAFSKLSGRNLECQVTKDYHRIEKGLSLSSPRRPFGIKVQERLEVLMGIDGASGSYIQYAGDAVSALESWNSGGVIDSLVSPDGRSLARASIDSDELEKFFASRRSVRSFDSSMQVPEGLIRSAVSMALNTPSVCNRQPWRVHVFEGAEAQDVLRHHNGSAAFASRIPTVAVVTTDSSLFSGSGERNQRWIDGGLFAMSFVWALHGQGLATCMLNWSRVNAASDALRQTAAIGDSEEIIVMIAIGYPTDSFRVARSSRRDVATVLVSSADRAAH